jgi:hypothetical protein
MVDAILLSNGYFSEQTIEITDEFWVDGEIVTWKTLIQPCAYVPEEGYTIFHKWRYDGNKDTSWHFLTDEHVGELL